MESVNLEASDEKSKQRNGAWGFWATIGFMLLITFMGFIAQIVATISAILFSRLLQLNLDMQASSPNGFVVAVSACAFAIVTIGSALAFAALRPGISLKEYFRFYNVEWQSYFKWFLAVIVLVLCQDALSIALGKPIVPQYDKDMYVTAYVKPLLWFALMVTAPLSEEILFRGFVFKGLQDSRVGVIGAILIGNIVWSAMHAQYDAYGIAQVFVAGLLLGAARLKTNSIYVPIAMHSFMNLIATVEIVLL